MKILVYVAGKYSGKNKKETQANIDIAKYHAIKLWEMGLAVICPHTNTAHFESSSKVKYKDFLAGCMEMVKSCDAIYMSPNWKSSPGAKEEHKIAKLHNIPILYSLKEATKFANKKHSRCFLTNKIRSSYYSFFDLKIDLFIKEKILQLTETINKEFYRKFIPIPRDVKELVK